MAGIGGIVEKDDFLVATMTTGTMPILARVVEPGCWAFRIRLCRIRQLQAL